jgi:hypothetical protein
MEIIASAIFGRSSFTLGLSRMIGSTFQWVNCPSNRIYKRCLVKASPPSLRYEHGFIVAEGDFIIVHGRYSNTGLPANWVVADIVKIENGVLAEHWDVIQDEATRDQSKSGLPMFGTDFPN